MSLKAEIENHKQQISSLNALADENRKEIDRLNNIIKDLDRNFKTTTSPNGDKLTWTIDNDNA